MKKWLKYITVALMSIALTFTMIPLEEGGVYADCAEDESAVQAPEAECESVPTDRYITPEMIPNSGSGPMKKNLKSGTKSMKTIPTAVVVVGFNDVPYSDSYDWGNIIFNTMTGKSIRSYFSDMSYGQMTFVPVDETSKYGTDGNTNAYDKTNDGVIHVNVDKDHRDWQTTDGGDADNAKIMIRSFIQAANKAKKYVDVSSLDANDNGWLDEEELALVYIFAGYDSGSTVHNFDDNKYLHNHKASIAAGINRYGMAGEVVLPKWNDKKLNPYVVISEKVETENGIVHGRKGSLAHELGHHLGLKDLYDTGSGNGPWKNYKVYDMSVMAHGSWAQDASGENCPTSFDPWSRIKLGWTEPSTIQLGFNGLAAQDFEHPTNKNNILKVPKASIYPYETEEENGEYYLIEVRRAEKWDEGISQNSTDWKTSDQKGGLVFWHIDDKVLAKYGGTKKINDSEHRPGVMPLYLENNFKTLISSVDYAAVHYTTPLFDKHNWESHKDDSTQFGDAINLPAYNGKSTTSEPIESKPDTRKFSGACIQILSDSDRYMYVRFWDRSHTHNYEKIVLEPAGYGYDGTAEYYCTGCGKSWIGSIPALPMEDKRGEDGTRLGKGASKEAAHKALTSYGKETDPAGSQFPKLKLKTVKQTKKSIKLSWQKAGAEKYVIYGSKCGKGKKLRRLQTVTSQTVTLNKVAGAKVKAKTYYKFIVVALDSDDEVVSTSKMIHVATKGSKVRSNHTSVYVSKKIRTKAKKLKKGKKLALKAKAKKKKGCKVAKHVGLRYQSGDPKVVKVTSKGTIKGVKKGKAKVWAYAQDGVCRTIYVTVK